ncbi:MAG: zinc-binding alcohol dehydrogenase family protein [Veillonellaceae bacterium]|jgi:L-gulonate 5-dehydrogenase|nr:zinc-binding alcohol dehydrogenase family protein [Veillonellaceae bacterium]
MKVIQANKPGELRIVDRPEPTAPAADEAIVRIKAAGICGSDVHILHGKNPFAIYPRILGHEAAGEVAAIGSAVTNVKVGDHVVIDNVFSCGKCYACRIGRPNVCSNVRVLGVHIDGVFSELIKLPADHLYPVPADLPWELAATMEPYAIAAEAIDRGQVGAGDTVLICGAGPIGLVILQACKSLGARVLIMDIVDARLKAAAAMGADAVVNTKNTDLEAAVKEFTEGEGINVAMEATGVISILELIVAKLMSPAGRVVVLGFPVEPAKLSPADIMKRELDIKGSRLNNRKFGEVVRWFAEKKVDPTGLVTHVLPYSDVEKGMELFANHPAEVCKVLIKFD